MEKAVQDYGRASIINYPDYQPGIFSRNPADPAFSETGLFGDPTKATAEKGRNALEVMARQWLNALQGFAQTPVQAQ